MSKQILSEEFRRMQKLAGIITEGEMWDKDPSHRDTYHDDDRNHEEEDFYIDEDFVFPATLEYNQNGKYQSIILHDVQAEEEYSANSFNLYKSREEFEKDVKKYNEMGSAIERLFEINGDDTYKYAILFPYYDGSKREDYGGM